MYFVVADNGQEFGPADEITLKAWAAENRVFPHTTLRRQTDGQLMSASTIPGLFSAAPAGPAPSTYNPAQAYMRPGTQMQAAVVNDKFPWNAVIRSVAALILFFVFHGIGLIVGGYAIYYAIQHYQSRSKYGLFALIFSIVCFIAIGIGWLLVLNGTVTK